MKKNLTGGIAIAIVVSIAMLLSSQNVQAQGCAAGGRGPGGSGAPSTPGTRGFSPGQQGGGFAQAMQMMQQAQQMMQYQQRFGSGNQQPSFTRPRGNNSDGKNNGLMRGNSLASNSKTTLNPNSAKAKRIAKLKERREARQKKKDDILAKRKADKEKRIAEFKKKQAEKK